MLGNLGFSYVGLIYLIMLFVPNIYFGTHLPEDFKDLLKKENKVLLVFERVGQVLVTVSALIFKDFNINGFSVWSIWLIVSFLLMVLYEICWIRYFKNPTLKTFYGRFLFIPIPLASLPVLAFLLLGIYGKVIWLIIASVFLGIGHIGIHLQHAKTVKTNNRIELEKCIVGDEKEEQ